jgi:hypothetical protein
MLPLFGIVAVRTVVFLSVGTQQLLHPAISEQQGSLSKAAVP